MGPDEGWSLGHWLWQRRKQTAALTQAVLRKAFAGKL